MREKILRIKEELGLKHMALITGALVIFAFFIIHNVKNKHYNTDSQIVEVEVAKVEVKDMAIEVKEIGTVVPVHNVAVTSRIDSQVMEILFNDGDKVTKGQVLFLLDDKAIKAQLKQLEANIIRDQAQLDYLKKEYERIAKVYQSGYETKEHVDQAQSAYEVQVATLKADQEAVNNAKVQLDYTVITASMTGKTGTINVDVGSNVKANDTQALVTINQIDPIDVQFALPQKYFGAVHEFMGTARILVRTENPETKEVINGHLEYIENTLDQNDNFGVRAVFPNQAERLWPGMYVSVVVTLGYNKAAKILPIAAVQSGQGDTKYVYIVEDDKAKKREVKVISTFDNHMVISEGVSLGEAVITHGLSGVKDGTIVKVVNANQANGKPL